MTKFDLKNAGLPGPKCSRYSSVVIVYDLRMVLF